MLERENYREFQFGSWRVNPSEGTIRNAHTEKRIEPKALSVLVTLAQADGQVVSRNALLDFVWPDQVVGDDVINSSIAVLRKALGDDRKTNRYIQTLPKKGYKLVQPIIWHESADVTSKQSTIQPSTDLEKRVDTSFPAKKIIATILTVLLVVIFLILQFINVSKENEGNFADNSIAILPFDVYSQDDEMVFFADGLVEEMLHQLASNPDLRVIARSASFQYRKSTKDLSTIASELNVKYLIEGSVREFNQELKITIQLVDAKNNYPLWSRVFDEKSSDLFRIQEHVGLAVNNMLSIDESKSSWKFKRRHTQSDQAYKYFVMAHAHFKAANSDSYKNAEILLNKAISIAPDYALAYSSKAVSHLLQYQYNHTRLEVAVNEASKAINRALELDPKQAEAYAARGLMYTYTEDIDMAEAAYLRAIALNPNLRIAHHNFGFLLWGQARYPQAIDHLEFALDTDPLAKPTNFLMGDSLGRLAYFDRAVEHFQHCQKVLPEFVWCFSGLADIYRITGNLDEAKVNMDKSALLPDTGDYFRGNSHASLLINLGEIKTAENMLNSVKQQTGATFTLFRNRFLIALQSRSLPQFYQRVENIKNNIPENIDIKKYDALIAYWRGDYQLAVKIYQEILQSSPEKMFELWDYADGLSHPIYLAVSYNKLGMHKEKQQLLMRIEQHLSSFSSRLERVPGCLYVRAQYDYLTGDLDSSTKALSKLQENWALSWLIKEDIFWDIQ